VLGFILGEPIERYMFISIERYGVSWMIKPFVLGMFALAALSLLGPLLQDIRGHGGLKKMVSAWGHPVFSTDNLFPAALLILFVVMLSQSLDWAFAARIVPTIVGVGALLFCGLSLANDVFGVHERAGAPAAAVAGGAPAQAGAGSGGDAKPSKKIHMDIASKTAHLPGATILSRGFMFFGWMASFMLLMWMIGLIPAVPIFIASYMRLEGREKWRIVIPMAVGVVLLIYVVFDQLLAIPWPPTLLGMFFPMLKVVPSV
jgi:hypothetical protein